MDISRAEWERRESGEDTNEGHDDDSSRKPGTRLSTNEEISLFETCNHHAETFGHRNKLCEWWMNVANEFTRNMGHPYSWHSVRRKVEIVTKRRIKLLEGHPATTSSKTLAEKLSNPRWRTAIDTWIPTWQRWEEAEAKRIEKRDSRKPRKRKEPINGFESWDVARSRTVSTAPSRHIPSTATDSNNNNNNNHQLSPFSVPSSSSPGRRSSRQNTASYARLPPGFNSIFSGAGAGQTTTGTANNNSNNINNPQNRQSTSKPTSTAHFSTDTTTASTSTSTAMLQAINRLTNNLESYTANLQSRLPLQTRSGRDLANITNGPISPATDGNREYAAASGSGVSLITYESVMKEVRREMEKDRNVLVEKLDALQGVLGLILQKL